MDSSRELIQGEQGWLMARCGSLGASQIKDALATIKSGVSASRKNMIAQLAVERLTGQPTQTFTTEAMQRGTDLEGAAREVYEFVTGNTVEQVGLIKHPTIRGTHASPDGLVGDQGCIEIKVPNSANHISYLLGGKVPPQYVHQVNWVMACTGTKWCDFVSYDPRLPANTQMFIVRVERDRKKIAEMEIAVANFLKEVEAMVEQLEAIGMQKAS